MNSSENTDSTPAPVTTSDNTTTTTTTTFANLPSMSPSSPQHAENDTRKKRTRSSFENHQLTNMSLKISNDQNDGDEDIIDDEDDEDDGDVHHRRKPNEYHSSTSNEDSNHKKAKLALDASLQNESSCSPSATHANEKSEEGNLAPSKVLFLRNLPPHCEETDIEAVMNAYHPNQIVLLRGSRQAFVQFDSIENATKFLESYKGNFHLGNRTIYVTYSDRQEIQQSSRDEKPNNILLATLSNVLYPTTVDVLHQVFSRYGDIDKIVVFSRNNNIQGLIQFADTQAAIAAKTALDGQNIYQNCCKLHIIFSKMKDLNVKVNNDRTRDYTNPNLPSEPYEPYAPYAPNPYEPAAARMHHPPSGYHYGGFYPTPPPPGPYGGYAGAFGAIPPPFMMPFGRPPESPVLFVKNIAPKVTCDHLFTLFGVYGDVERVKILPSSKASAMVEFTSPYGADIALSYLSYGCPLFGRVISVVRSNHFNINAPRSSSSSSTTSDEQFKDYHNSPFHRFRRSSSKNYNHICPPSNSLHISNIHSQVTEEEVKNLFTKHSGGEVREVRFFVAKPSRSSASSREIENKMAIVELNDLDSAIRSLVELHNYNLNGLNIKVTFSEKRRKPNPRTSTSSSNSGRRDSMPYK